METETAKMMWTRAQNSGLYYDILIENEDVTTRKKLFDEVSENLKKKDHNHIRRNLKDQLFKLKKDRYSGTEILSTVIIMKLKSDFSVAIKINRGDTELCKLVIEYNFWCHQMCGSWC
jgi:hypothetical protein